MNDHDQAAANELKTLVEAHAERTGNDVTVGVHDTGRGHPRYVVTRRGQSRIPLATWVANWDGWRDKAEADLREKGLLPDEKETKKMPAPSHEEIRRSNALRERMQPLAEAGRKEFISLVIEKMAEHGLEPFGGHGASTAPDQIAKIQLVKFLDEGRSMVTSSLDRWEGALDLLADDEGEVDATGILLVAPKPEPKEPLEQALEEARSQLAERDDELVEAHRDLEAALRKVTELEDRLAAAEAAGPSTELVRRAEPVEVHSVFIEEPDPELRRRYADTLLRELDRCENGEREHLLRRLDALVGIRV